MLLVLNIYKKTFFDLTIISKALFQLNLRSNLVEFASKIEFDQIRHSTLFLKIRNSNVFVRALKKFKHLIKESVSASVLELVVVILLRDAKFPKSVPKILYSIK